MPKHTGVMKDCNIVYIIKCICLVLRVYVNITAQALGVCLLLVWVRPARRVDQYRSHGPFLRFDLALNEFRSFSFRSVSALSAQLRVVMERESCLLLQSCIASIIRRFPQVPVMWLKFQFTSTTDVYKLCQSAFVILP